MTHIGRCYLCREKVEPKVYSYVNNAAFYTCPNCSLIWLDKDRWPINQQEYYSTQYYTEGFSGRKNLKELFLYRFKLIKKYFKPHGTILEVGAASGDFLSLLQDAGYEVQGIDLSKRAVAQAKLNHNIRLFEGTLEDATFPAEFFDYIVMYHVLEHLPDPRATLREARRVMKDGGRILIEVPNVRSIDTAFSKRLLLNVLDYPNHLYAFSCSSLRRMMSEEGFKPVALENGFPFLLAKFMGRLTCGCAQSLVLKEKAETGAVVSGKEMIQHIKPDALVKRMVQKILPGMKITIIGEK